MTEPLLLPHHAPLQFLLHNGDPSILPLTIYKSSCQGFGFSPVFSVGLWKIFSLSPLPLDQRQACLNPLSVELVSSCRVGPPQSSSMGQVATPRRSPTQDYHLFSR